MAANHYEEVVKMALTLTPKEQLRLIERLASAVEVVVTPAQPQPEHWGQSVIAVLDQYDFSDWQDIEDPVAWVQEQREKEMRQRRQFWDIPE